MLGENGVVRKWKAPCDRLTWGWNPEDGSLDWYPELDKPLGPPKGDAVQKGWTFQREFEHASVFVDLESRTGEIDWRSAR